MKQIETIKIDIAFPEYGDGASDLKKMLSNGWHIIDKTVMSERYIYYVLERYIDTDVGTTSDSNKE